MSWRARAFLLTLAFRHCVIGLLCVITPDLFTSESFTVMRQFAPLEWWGYVLVLIGAQAIAAAVVQSEWWARVVLIASAGLTAGWCAGFTAAGFIGVLDAPSLPVTWAALTAKDLILSAMPLRTPLEDVVARRVE